MSQDRSITFPSIAEPETDVTGQPRVGMLSLLRGRSTISLNTPDRAVKWLASTNNDEGVNSSFWRKKGQKEKRGENSKKKQWKKGRWIWGRSWPETSRDKKRNSISHLSINFPCNSLLYISHSKQFIALLGYYCICVWEQIAANVRIHSLSLVIGREQGVLANSPLFQPLCFCPPQLSP